MSPLFQRWRDIGPNLKFLGRSLIWYEAPPRVPRPTALAYATAGLDELMYPHSFARDLAACPHSRKIDEVSDPNLYIHAYRMTTHMQ